MGELTDVLIGKATDAAPTTDDWLFTYDQASAVLKKVTISDIIGAAALLKALADAKGDLIVASAADVFDRLPVGSDGQMFYVDSTQPLGVKWGAPPSGSGIVAGIMDAKGDIIVATAADTPARKAIGADGQVLTADSSQADGMVWQDQEGLTTSVTSDAAPTPAIAAGGRKTNYALTALAEAAVFGEPTGSPNDFHKLLYRIKDNGTVRALTWNVIYRGIQITLPSVTVAGKTTYVGYIYNEADAKWDGVATVTQT